MKITKIGHCCLLIEVDGVRIVTDPGVWTTFNHLPNNIDAIVITHEHGDHYHVPLLKELLAVNPQAKVYANKAVGKLLEKEGIAHELIEHEQEVLIKTIKVKGFGEEHAPIYPGIPSVENTGLFIAEQLFYPGDAFFVPPVKVDVLALPVAGPWLKISEAIDFAKEIKPRIAFPVHDGMLATPGPFHMVPQKILETMKIDFRPLGAGDELSL